MVKEVGLALLLALAASGCDNKVRQAQPPRIPDDPSESALAEDGDIAAQPEEITPVEVREPTAEEKRYQCCQECAAGLEADRSGDAPDAIPCEDFTVDVKERCRKWFLINPMKASEAKACVEQGPPPPPPEPEPEES